MSERNYLCLQKRSASEKPAPPSPKDMEDLFAKFNAWRAKYEDKIVDMGGKLGAGRHATADRIVDGPLVEVKELIGGYMIVRASDLDEAAKIAQESPGTAFPGSYVEVREIVTS